MLGRDRRLGAGEEAAADASVNSGKGKPYSQ